jgi:hypothetical protein
MISGKYIGKPKCGLQKDQTCQIELQTRHHEIFVVCPVERVVFQYETLEDVIKDWTIPAERKHWAQLNGANPTPSLFDGFIMDCAAETVPGVTV